MVLAAGEGRRLVPLTDELPKPALPVGNRPAAWFALDSLARAGLREVTLNAFHLADRLRETIEASCPPGVRLRFVTESVLLGTGGGIRNAWRPEGNEPLLVANGKLVFAPDLDAALRRHVESGAIATMVLREMPRNASFAPVEIDADGRVRRVRGLPETASGAGLRALMFTGVQILSARAWRDLPLGGDVVAQAYLPWLARGETVASVIDDGPWLDVGVSLGHYLDANLALATGTIAWPGVAPGPDGVLVDERARVGAGARLVQAVVGAGAVVAPDLVLRRVVVWPGARVERDLSDAIVTSGGRVVVP